MPPGANPDSTPSGPSTTSTTSSSPVTQMQTIDDTSARAAGVGATVAAVSSKGTRLCGRRAHSVSGKPPSTMRRAIGAPWLPNPMKPTLSVIGAITRAMAGRGTWTPTPTAAVRASAEAGACRNPAQPSSRSATCTAKGSTSRPCALARSRALAACTLKRTTCRIRCDRSGSGTVGHQCCDRVVEALRRGLETLGEILEDPDLVLDGGDEAHVVAPVDLALFEEGEDVALDPGPDVTWLELRNQQGAAFVDVREPVLEDGDDELLLGSEVVLHGRVVATARGGADLAQRHALVAAFGEEPLGREDDLLLGGEGERRRRHHRTIAPMRPPLYRTSQVS